jgi:hypothetical protein
MTAYIEYLERILDAALAYVAAEVADDPVIAAEGSALYELSEALASINPTLAQTTNWKQSK